MCPGSRIKEIQVVGPFGLRSSISAALPGSSDQWYSDIVWTPDESQIGGNLICTLATDNDQMSSDLSCITVIVGVTSPRQLNNTASPTGTLTSSYLLGVNGVMNFQISFSSVVTRPVKNVFIRVNLVNGTEVAKFDASNSSQVTFVNSTIISFSFPVYSFIPGSYYVTFDQGVGVGQRELPQYCDPESNQILDSTFWTFIVPQSTL
jgi:hypothetical protein